MEHVAPTDVSVCKEGKPSQSFLIQIPIGHHVMLFFSVSRCAEALCQKTIQLLVSRMLACARSRTWIPVKWPRSLGVRMYAF
jgi:hypothetical protein